VVDPALSEQEIKTPMPVSLEPDPVIEVYKKDVDRTLLQENLKLTVEERFQSLMQLQRFAEEMRQAGRQAFWNDRA
jgi:hypothetical protein